MRLSFVTLMLPVPDFPSTGAVSVAAPPWAPPTSCPAGVIEATAGLLLLQVNVLARRAPEASRASAVARTVSPTRIAEGRVTATVATAFPPLPVMLNPPQPVPATRATREATRSKRVMWTRRGGPGSEVGIDVHVSLRGRQRASSRARALPLLHSGRLGRDSLSARRAAVQPESRHRDRRPTRASGARPCAPSPGFDGRRAQSGRK